MSTCDLTFDHNDDLADHCCALLVECSEEIIAEHKSKYDPNTPLMSICEMELEKCCNHNTDWKSQACTTKLARD